MYRAAFAAIRDLVPKFVPEHIMAGFEEASVAAPGSILRLLVSLV